MKMTVYQFTTTTKKVDIELPYCSKEGDRYFMVLSENEIWAVEDSKMITEVKIYRGICQDLPFSPKAVQINEFDFFLAYNAAVKKIKEVPGHTHE